MKEKITEHPSFGMLRISRVSGCIDNLFGSSIKHQHFIELTISTASLRRNLHRDWFYSNKELINVQMSMSQFAEAITSLNTSGTPVTLRHIQGQQIEKCPFGSKIKEFDQEFEQRILAFTRKLHDGKARVKEILNKPRINKEDCKTVENILFHIFQEIESNIPFIKQSFSEQIEKTITEAKGEIEAFLTHKIHSAGLKNLQDDSIVKLENNMGKK